MVSETYEVAERASGKRYWKKPSPIQDFEAGQVLRMNAADFEPGTKLHVSVESPEADEPDADVEQVGIAKLSEMKAGS